ncbi:DUF502 domain-containing protein [Candidatus Bipolaricaulota bacterium]|nr:DUF502 domain-containing protein [Candidatus Bipolaricaulota bacterium]MBS3814871.1 DUF502 domain-containing protein [Candidatus Bipolaricaulota bacterium]MBS3825913.1 DUF502 domain-containing protein [Candidatus Bipolaricaulota bacterium]
MKFSRIAHKFRDILIDGLVTILPITITGYLLWLGYSIIDRFFGRGTVIGARLSHSLERLFGIEWIPGLSIIYTAIIIVLLGLISRFYLGRLLQRYLTLILNKLPLVKKIYPPAQEVSEAILGRSSFSSFKEAVLIEYPRPGSYTLGFVTNRIGDKVSVYIFTTPDPFTGRILFLPDDQVTYLDMSVEEGIKFLISMGISAPDALYEDQERNKNQRMTDKVDNGRVEEGWAES